MKKYLKLFKNHNDYLTFKQNITKENFPNVSHCIDTDDVHYNDKFMGHAYVDLGLTSGTKWAKMNVGANSETDYGDYFMWGSTTPNTVNECTWANAPFNNGSSTFDETYFNSVKDTVCPNGVLAKEYDAAHVKWGGEWHMPDMAQCLELFKETKNGFVTDAGAFTQFAWSDSNSSSSPTSTKATIGGWNTAGYLFFKNSYTSVTDAIGARDYLFVPAAGSCGDGEVSSVGIYGGVWTSNLYSENVEYAWNLGFSSPSAGEGSGYRYYGFPVRGVVGQITD